MSLATTTILKHRAAINAAIANHQGINKMSNFVHNSHVTVEASKGVRGEKPTLNFAFIKLRVHNPGGSGRAAREARGWDGANGVETIGHIKLNKFRLQNLNVTRINSCEQPKKAPVQLEIRPA